MHAVKAILLEAGVVLVLGLAIAVVANALSPVGLELRRDYFPSVPESGATPPSSAVATAEAGIAADQVIRRIQQRGLQTADATQVAQWFADRRSAQGLVVFIDSREAAEYKAGHVPGAWPFDYYHPETDLPVVLPLCLTAETIVVYCEGGSCEDSEFAAVLLRDTGIPAERIHVYAGGFGEWKRQGLPVEKGVRGSGEILDRGR